MLACVVTRSNSDQMSFAGTVNVTVKVTSQLLCAGHQRSEMTALPLRLFSRADSVIR
jgi:hypothetical protein